MWIGVFGKVLVAESKGLCIHVCDTSWVTSHLLKSAILFKCCRTGPNVFIASTQTELGPFLRNNSIGLQGRTLQRPRLHVSLAHSLITGIVVAVFSFSLCFNPSRFEQFEEQLSPPHSVHPADLPFNAQRVWIPSTAGMCPLRFPLFFAPVFFSDSPELHSGIWR